MRLQDFIQQRFSGALNNEAEYIELLVQVFAVLVLGLVMWRIMAIFHKKKKAKRKGSTYFNNAFAEKWKE